MLERTREKEREERKRERRERERGEKEREERKRERQMHKGRYSQLKSATPSKKDRQGLKI